MTKGLFVTATGTEVGKTFVSALLVKWWKEQGKTAGYFKGVLSGLEEEGLSDPEYVAKVAGLSSIPTVPFCYQASVSPHLASKKEGNPVELPVILEEYAKVAETCEVLTVEGSGGIVCPLRYDDNVQLYLKDVIQKLALPSVVVAGAGLGTINGTVLTIDYMKAHKLEVRGIIFNGFEPENPLHQDNLFMVEQLTGVPVVATVAKNATDLEITPDAMECLYGCVK